VNPIESEALVPDLSIHKGVVSHPVTDTDLTFPYKDPTSEGLSKYMIGNPNLGCNLKIKKHTTIFKHEGTG
jgi:hypothetical protein